MPCVERGVAPERIFVSLERNMRCGLGHCGHCQLGPTLICRDGPVYSLRGREALARGQGAVSAGDAKPKLAVWKFASCDGCQLSLLDCEDELLALTNEVEIAYFLEATSGTVDGPYDLSLVEGSITTAHDAERIQQVRAASKALVTIGACATAGGIQALRNYGDVAEFAADRLRVAASTSRRSPRRRRSRRTFPSISSCTAVRSTRGSWSRSSRRSCTVGEPGIPSTSVCTECKRRGTVCVMVAHGTPCLGPVTHAGCGALCPSYNRGCYGCFGPKETPNTVSLTRQLTVLGMDGRGVDRVFHTFNTEAPGFKEVRVGG